MVPPGTCSPCPVRRQTVARLVGALVHKEGPAEGGPLSSVGSFRQCTGSKHLVGPSRRTERRETAAAQKVPSPRAVKRTWFH